MGAELTVRPISEAQPTSGLASRVPHVRKGADAAQKFEAFVLQTFIQELMPETPESVFGSGISGDFWKSMMSEKIAEQVAERGSVGIADYVRDGRAVPHRPSGFNPLDVISPVSNVDGAAAQLDPKPVSGE